MGRGIEIANAAVVGRANECVGDFVRDRRKKVAERRAAETERGVVDLHGFGVMPEIRKVSGIAKRRLAECR